MTILGVVAACAVLAIPASASAAHSANYKWPAFLKGSVTGSTYDYYPGEPAGEHSPCGGCAPVPTPASPSSTETDRWRIPDLKLKRQRVKVLSNQIQVVYRIVDGNVTWSHEQSFGCEGPVSFTETFSLKGAKWDVDSRITFFGPKTGRYKNRWRISGEIGLIREKQMEPCAGGGEPARITLPELVTGTKVGEPAPVARPGKRARLSWDYHTDLGGVSDHKNALTIRLPPLNH